MDFKKLLLIRYNHEMGHLREMNRLKEMEHIIEMANPKEIEAKPRRYMPPRAAVDAVKRQLFQDDPIELTTPNIVKTAPYIPRSPGKKYSPPPAAVNAVKRQLFQKSKKKKISLLTFRNAYKDGKKNILFTKNYH